jgi:hypothetical protein
VSGRKQHYIPQSLLRGFASRTKGTISHTFCFQLDGKVFEPNIDGIAAERDFYSDPTDTLLDDEITRKEHAYGALLNEIRQTPLLTDEMATAIVELIAHLMTRTRVVRTWMSDGIQKAMDALLRTVVDPIIVRAGINDYMNPRNPKLLNAIRDAAREKGRDLNRNQLAAYAIQASSAAKLIQAQLVRDFIRTVREAVEFTDVNASERAAAVHRKAVFTTLNGSNRLAALQKLPISMIEFPTQEPLILGDCPVIQLDREAKALNLANWESECGSVALPISGTRAVVLGMQHADLSARLLNLATASSSRKFFVAPGPRAVHEAYMSSIGALADPIAEIDFSRIGEDLMKQRPWR